MYNNRTYKRIWCPRGQILRHRYTRKNGTRVKASCIQDRGQPGKGPQYIYMSPKKRGMLKKYGYSLSVSDLYRKRALNLALKHMSYHTLLKRLVAIRTLHKSNSTYYTMLDTDITWLQSKHRNMNTL